MTEHQHTDTCTTCCRPKGCPECGQSWPRGVPGHIGEDKMWHDGPPQRKVPHRPTGEQAAYDQALAKYDQARAAWEDVEMRRRAVEHKVRSSPELHSYGQPHVLRDPKAEAELKRLTEAEQQAREERDRAGKAVVAARQAAATRAYQA